MAVLIISFERIPCPNDDGPGVSPGIIRAMKERLRKGLRAERENVSEWAQFSAAWRRGFWPKLRAFCVGDVHAPRVMARPRSGCRLLTIGLPSAPCTGKANAALQELRRVRRLK